MLCMIWWRIINNHTTLTVNAYWTYWSSTCVGRYDVKGSRIPKQHSHLFSSREDIPSFRKYGPSSRDVSLSSDKGDSAFDWGTRTVQGKESGSLKFLYIGAGLLYAHNIYAINSLWRLLWLDSAPSWLMRCRSFMSLLIMSSLLHLITQTDNVILSHHDLYAFIQLFHVVAYTFSVSWLFGFHFHDLLIWFCFFISQNFSSRLAALDYTACLHSEVFVTTQGGNFPQFLIGHRRYLYGGHSKTLKPDKRKLAVLLDNPALRLVILWNKKNSMCLHL